MSHDATLEALKGLGRHGFVLPIVRGMREIAEAESRAAWANPGAFARHSYAALLINNMADSLEGLY